jgi:spermidine synthase
MALNLRKLLIVAFVFSGMAALIYQITWIRPLQFLLGSTVYTISIIFSAFMGGLALGSWIVSKYADDIKNLPQAYGLMEIGIGIYGVLLLSIFNLLPQIYNALYGLHTNFYLFGIVQFLLVFIVLLVPTTLMGATFPVIVKYYTEKKIGKAIGEAYAANNLGAIFGSFAAGFILIPLIGIKGSIIFAGSINMIIGSIIVLKANGGKNE